MHRHLCDASALFPCAEKRDLLQKALDVLCVINDIVREEVFTRVSNEHALHLLTNGRRLFIDHLRDGW
jgi:hypothetical protein